MDQGGTAQGAAAAAVRPSRGRKLLRVVSYVLACVMTVLTVLSVIGSFGLPGCDAKRTRDVLSTLNQRNNVDATRYNAITTRQSGETEVLCTANLALKDGSSVEYDYRIFKNGSETQVAITDWRRP